MEDKRAAIAQDDLLDVPKNYSISFPFTVEDILIASMFLRTSGFEVDCLHVNRWCATMLCAVARRLASPGLSPLGLLPPGLPPLALLPPDLSPLGLLPPGLSPLGLLPPGLSPPGLPPPFGVVGLRVAGLRVAGLRVAGRRVAGL